MDYEACRVRGPMSSTPSPHLCPPATRRHSPQRVALARLVVFGLATLATLATLAPLATPARAESRGELTTATFESRTLGGRQSYVVWLPPSRVRAPKSKEPLPIVVLLHGLGGEGRDWFDPALGALGPSLLQAIATGDMPEVIAIAPNGHNGYWTDHLAGGSKKAAKHKNHYGAFIDEVIAHAEARFSGSGVRAIVGASMGGHGALSRALMAPERFAAVVSMAGALFPEPPTHRKIYKLVWGDPADPDHWARTAPMALMRGLEPNKAPPIFLHCGKNDLDRFLDMTMGAAERLRSLGVPFELALTEGGHGWTTWRGVNARWLAWLGPKLRSAGR